MVGAKDKLTIEQVVGAPMLLKHCFGWNGLKPNRIFANFFLTKSVKDSTVQEQLQLCYDALMLLSGDHDFVIHAGHRGSSHFDRAESDREMQRTIREEFEERRQAKIKKTQEKEESKASKSQPS